MHNHTLSSTPVYCSHATLGAFDRPFKLLGGWCMTTHEGSLSYTMWMEGDAQRCVMQAQAASLHAGLESD